MTGKELSLALAFLLACHSEQEDSPSPDDTDHQEPIDSEAPLGGLTILEATIVSFDDDFRSWAQIWGPYDQALEDPVWGASWEYVSVTLLADGDCALEDTFPSNFCEPTCGNDQWCGEDGECLTLPSNAHAGTIEVEGLLAPFSLEPTDFGWYTSDDQLPVNLVNSGAVVTATAAGGETAAFVVSATAPASLDEPIDCDIELQAGQDLQLSWTPAYDGSRIRWEMIAVYHAGNGPMVICEVDEGLGSLTVPAAVIDSYLPHRTPAETLQLTRFAREQVALDSGGAFWLELASMHACW